MKDIPDPGRPSGGVPPPGRGSAVPADDEAMADCFPSRWRPGCHFQWYGRPGV